MFLCNSQINWYWSKGEDDLMYRDPTGKAYEYLEKDYLFPHEFLYLIPNCIPKSDEYVKILQKQLSNRLDRIKHWVQNYEFVAKDLIPWRETETELYRLFKHDFKDHLPMNMLKENL